MHKSDVIALLLAGGQGSRLGILTKTLAKPAVLYGGKYRIIDFTLSNCVNSGIDTVGVLTQYQPLKLHTHIGMGKPWDMDRIDGGVTILSPYLKSEMGEWYKGTANAVFQNINYIDNLAPKYVVVLSGDHIYKMDYSEMVEFHIKNNADATISVIDVPIDEANRYGIMNTKPDASVYEFEEKPSKPKSTLASMGVYVFNWEVLRDCLIRDNENPSSNNDFGRNIIPMMLEEKRRLFAFRFDGYWKDVGTIQALWESNMDLIDRETDFDLFDQSWKIYTENPPMPANYISPSGDVKHSVVAEGCTICGTVKNSVIFPGVYIGEGTMVEDSIVMTGSYIGAGCKVIRGIVGEKAKINEDVWIGVGEDVVNELYPHIYDSGISVMGEESVIPKGARIGKNVMVDIQAKETDFKSLNVDSGSSILRGGAK